MQGQQPSNQSSGSGGMGANSLQVLQQSFQQNPVGLNQSYQNPNSQYPNYSQSKMGAQA